MTSIKEAIYSHLTHDDAVVAFVKERVYPVGTAPATPRYPLLTYQRISGVHERHLKGGTGIVNSRMQINCWAESGRVVDDLADAVRESMDNFRGRMGQGESMTTVLAAHLDDDNDVFVPPTSQSATGKFGVQMDFLFFYEESLTPV